MKKLMFVAVAALSTAAVAAHSDLSANVEGYYDVTLTTKHLAHAEKTASINCTTKTRRGVTTYAYDEFTNQLAVVQTLAGFTPIELKVDTKVVPTDEGPDVEAKKISLKYSYYDFKIDRKTGATNMVTKVISKASNGVYDAKDGKVYLWDKDNKVTVKYGETDAIVESDQDRSGNERDQKGYKAYEVPLAMHGQFVATDDGKAAGGFTGGTAVATDDSVLDFAGLTAFGTGTLDSKTANLKTVAGNVAGKYPDDLKYGCYGTWKLNLDSKSSKYKTLKDALLAKKCVELVTER